MNFTNRAFRPGCGLGRVHILLCTAVLVSCNGCESIPTAQTDASTVSEDATNLSERKDSVGTAASEGVQARFVVDGSSLFDMPFPIDLRRDASGALDLSGFPNPENNNLVSTYLEGAMRELDGFSIVPTVYFQFDDAIDEDALTPTVQTGDDGANVVLVNVDRESFQYSVRIPVTTRFWSRDDGVYIPKNTLSVQPVFGLPLKENTTYACLVLRSVGDGAGNPLGQPAVVAQGLADEGPLATLYAPLNAWLNGFGSYISRNDIAVATVFTTGAPSAELARIAEHIRSNVTVSPFTDVSPLDKPNGYYTAYEGRYLSPNYQTGEKPYETEGGAILFDADGIPLMSELESLRFAITIPKGREMPSTGWPIVLYGHGTGGDYQSFLSSGGNAPASALAKRGFAVLSIDQPLHGDRGTTSDPVFLSFNFNNIDAARANFRQSAIDVLVQLKMAKQGLAFDIEDTTIVLDPEHVYYFGHSHGALVGALFTPFAPEFKATVLSAAGGGLSHTLMLRKDLGGVPLDFAQLVQALLGTVDGELGIDHPVMSVLQMLVDITDPIAYAGLYNPVGGADNPPNVLLTEGLLDAATPPTTTEYLAAAARVPILKPIQQASLTHDILGLLSVDKPVSGNYTSKSGAATSVLAQFADADHFAVFSNAKAADLVGDYLESAYIDGVPVVD
ncbi:MAG: alpha/beta fold hydrolase [Myxococcota bacterium]|nr:alpha/beta fold hydrolase [Myxococcota bacterium]